MMKIFLVEPEFDDAGDFVYRWLTPVHEVDWLTRWRFDCTVKAGDWREEDGLVEFEDPSYPLGDFPYVVDSVIVFTQDTLRALRETVTGCGELLGLHTRAGERFPMLNPTPCYHCVDEDATLWNSPNRSWIERYEFVKDRLPPLSLFKSQADESHVLATDGWLDEGLEFKRVVERLGLRGLTFREVWNDEGRELPELGP